MSRLFLDANILIYLFDETSTLHKQTIKLLNKEIKKSSELFISHHVLEEFIFIQIKLATITHESDSYNKLREDFKRIAQIPTLSFVEPEENFDFIAGIIDLMERYQILANDAYILAIILQNKNMGLMTYDKKLVKVANKLKIDTPSMSG